MQTTTLVNRKRALNAIKQIDAFPKVPESYQQTSASGGGISIVVFAAIAVLVVSEISYYSATELKFNYAVDGHYDAYVLTLSTWNMQTTTLVNRKRALNAIKQIDAFPKVPESYQQTSASGGGISIVVFAAIAVLVVSEISYYSATELKFNYAVDGHYDAKLKLDIDMTVAMPCATVGADVLDMTGAAAAGGHGSQLAEEDVYFDLSPKQRSFFSMLQSVNSYIQQEYHAIHDVLWRSGLGGLSRNMPPRDSALNDSHVTQLPPREDGRTGKKDGCRLHGAIAVNKVAGNFHITAGKIKVQTFGSDSHAHLALGIKDTDYNFSHRIDRFSYGDFVAGIVNPLDGEEKITTDNYHMYQYFVQVVPTAVDTRDSQVDTYQYAVTERNRTISHKQGSHGVPGIFVKYDLSALRVSVREEHRPYWRFLVRLCGIVGGIVQVSGILHSLTGMLVDAICCRWYTRSSRPSSQPANNANLQPTNGDSLHTSRLSPGSAASLQQGHQTDSTGPAPSVSTGPYSVESPLLTQS